jgi:hypothetical protein
MLTTKLWEARGAEEKSLEDFAAKIRSVLSELSHQCSVVQPPASEIGAPPLKTNRKFHSPHESFGLQC